MGDNIPLPFRPQHYGYPWIPIVITIFYRACLYKRKFRMLLYIFNVFPLIIIKEAIPDMGKLHPVKLF